MKNIFKFKMLALLLVVFTSCEEELDRITYSDDDGLFVSFVASNITSYSISVDDAMGSFDISISASRLSNQDRSFNIVLDSEATTADLSTFILPEAVTIPAGEYFGTMTVQIINNDMLDPSAKNIVFGLDEESANFDIDSNVQSISVFEVCPVPDDFMVGEYDIIDVEATIGPGNGTENFQSGTVTISATSSTSRAFEVAILPAFRGPTIVTFDLVCNSLIMRPTGPEPAIACGATDYTYADDGNNTYSLVTGDESFIITYIEDDQSSCGGPYAASFSLTKQ